jgi:hypothetical protein
MQCPKFTEAGKHCTLPVGHPNFCSADPRPTPVMTKAGLEAQQLVDAYQREKPNLQRNPKCEGCHGRSYNELPDPDSFGRVVEHSICSKCGGYTYVREVRRVAYASKPERGSSPSISRPSPAKTHSGKLETPDLAAARIAEAQRRAGTKQAPRPKPRNYMAEAAAQAEKDYQAMTQWNGC